MPPRSIEDLLNDSESLPAVRQRKPSLKRRLLEEDEDEPAPRRAHKTSNKRIRSTSVDSLPPPSEDLEVNVDVDVDIDVETEAHIPEPESVPSKRPAPQTTSVPSMKKKKRKGVVLSDDDDDEFDEPARLAAVDDEDEGFEAENVRRREKAPAAPRQGKAILSTKIPKKKGKERDEKPILMKDESRAAVAGGANAPAAASDTADTGIAGETTPTLTGSQEASSNQVSTSAPPMLPKRKLPTIKKNKPLVPSGSGGSGTSTPTSTKAPALPNSASKDTLATGTTTGPGLRNRQSAATIGNKDLDLSNSAVYAELFTKSSGASRAGGNSRQKEDERRKELNRMRDEARAKREAELKTCFDLQAQAEKVARFEDRFRTHRRRAYFVSHLGGSFLDDYDARRAAEAH